MECEKKLRLQSSLELMVKSSSFKISNFQEINNWHEIEQPLSNEIFDLMITDCDITSANIYMPAFI